MSIHITKAAWKKMSEILTHSKYKYGFILSSHDTGFNKVAYNLSILNKQKHNSIQNNMNTNILLDVENMIKLYVDPYDNENLDNIRIDYVPFENGVDRFYFHNNESKNTFNNCMCGLCSEINIK
tara:strand:+ start:3277 stop:3648 length:372 start_codon:yes stop_codon:yes gene_type:complete